VILKPKSVQKNPAACGTRNCRKESSPTRDYFCEVVALCLGNVHRKFQLRPNSQSPRKRVFVQPVRAATKIIFSPFRLRHLHPVNDYIIKMKLQLIYFITNTEKPKQVATEIEKYNLQGWKNNIGYRNIRNKLQRQNKQRNHNQD